MVKKKDGSVRFCIDYRRLNEVTVADQYPLPRIDDVLEALHKGRYFAVIDLKSGYWQIPLEEADAPKTAFRTLDGLYQFNVMPFGLRNAPATFQRLMDVVFSGMKWKGLLVYMDDIVVYSETPEEHLALLEDVLKRLAMAGLKLNPKKTVLVAKEVNYLGHVVSFDGIKPNPKKVQAVQSIRPPTNVREVRMFLGLTGYYRKFIPAYATLAGPLHNLTKKDQVFEWTAECQKAFELLKQCLITAPILAYPQRERQSIVDCDASADAVGAVLMQKTEDGREVAIQYASRSFSEQEKRWTTMEKEAFAIVWAVTTFRTYLLGERFVVRTDNSAAATLKKAKQPKLQRWAVLLAEFDYHVEHRPGKLQTHVDALSRLPADNNQEYSESDYGISDCLTALLASREEESYNHPSLPTIDWNTAAQQDKEIQSIRSYLQGPASDTMGLPDWFKAKSAQERARFILANDNVVYRGFPPRERSRWLVPAVLRRALVARHHRGAHGAHLGVVKLAAQLGLRFYWPSMVSTIK